jgi:hypothetical protein
MPTTATTTKSTRHTARPSTVKSSKAPAKVAKPTKWGKDMLAKMEAFRKALAAQR